MLGDQLRGLLVDERLDHVLQRLPDDRPHASLVPSPRQAEHGLAYPGQLLLARAQVHVHELPVDSTHDVAPGDQSLPVRRPGAGGHALAGRVPAGPDVAAAALVRLEADAGPHLRLLPWGDDAGSPIRSATVADGERLALSLAGRRPVVVDCGPPGTAAGAAVASTATVSLLVLRPCFLALRRAVAAPFRPSGVLLVEEPGPARH